MAQFDENIDDLTIGMKKLSLEPGDTVAGQTRTRRHRQALREKFIQPTVLSVVSVSNKVNEHQVRSQKKGENENCSTPSEQIARRSTRVRKRKICFDELMDDVDNPKPAKNRQVIKNLKPTSLSGCREILNLKRGRKVRFSNEVQIYFVDIQDESRVCTEWHKNLTQRGMALAMTWKQELYGEEQSEGNQKEAETEEIDMNTSQTN